MREDVENQVKKNIQLLRRKMKEQFCSKPNSCLGTGCENEINYCYQK